MINANFHLKKKYNSQNFLGSHETINIHYPVHYKYKKSQSTMIFTTSFIQDKSYILSGIVETKVDHPFALDYDNESSLLARLKYLVQACTKSISSHTRNKLFEWENGTAIIFGGLLCPNCVENVVGFYCRQRIKIFTWEKRHFLGLHNSTSCHFLHFPVISCLLSHLWSQGQVLEGDQVASIGWTRDGYKVVLAAFSWAAVEHTVFISGFPKGEEKPNS